MLKKIKHTIRKNPKLRQAYQHQKIFHEICSKMHEHRVRVFSEIHRIEEAPGPMLAGIELFQHRFSGNPENHSKILT